MSCQADARPLPRSRAGLALALGMTIAAGLGSRTDAAPEFVSSHAGDALWTVAAYLALALVAPRARTRSLFVVALGVSFAVELGQLVEVDWVQALRSTTPGRLLLGQGWQWADLPRYAAGAVLAACLDVTLLRRIR